MVNTNVTLISLENLLLGNNADVVVTGFGLTDRKSKPRFLKQGMLLVQDEEM